jgi:hypothetical protein
VTRYPPKHRAPGRHKARRRFAPSATPTFAAVTAASLGVTGVFVGGAFLTGGFGGAKSNKLLTSDLRLPGSLAATKAPQQKASPTPTYTSKPAVTPPPKVAPNITATGGGIIDREAVEQRREEERASRAAARVPAGSAQAIAARLIAEEGWSDSQFSCLDSLWSHESGWRVDATNPSSGAYGIPQALPGSKMSVYGADWRTNPETQIRWGLNYIASRYSTPCGAWYTWQSQGWY